MCVILKNELFEAVTDCVQVHHVVRVDLASHIVKFVAVELGVTFVGALFDLVDGGGGGNVEMDEFVGDYF